jgi:hypothetical protein
MMVSIYVPLPPETARALHELAVVEHRSPKQQAAYLIERELSRLGLLPKDKSLKVQTEVTNVEPNR